MPIVDYNDPNAVWRRTGYNPYKGMSEEDMMKAGCLQGAVFVGMIILAFIIFIIFV